VAAHWILSRLARSAGQGAEPSASARSSSWGW
jgi:hypothetical protein